MRRTNQRSVEWLPQQQQQQRKNKGANRKAILFIHQLNAHTYAWELPIAWFIQADKTFSEMESFLTCPPAQCHINY